MEHALITTDLQYELDRENNNPYYIYIHPYIYYVLEIMLFLKTQIPQNVKSIYHIHLYVLSICPPPDPAPPLISSEEVYVQLGTDTHWQETTDAYGTTEHDVHNLNIKVKMFLRPEKEQTQQALFLSTLNLEGHLLDALPVAYFDDKLKYITFYNTTYTFQNDGATLK